MDRVSESQLQVGELHNLAVKGLNFDNLTSDFYIHIGIILPHAITIQYVHYGVLDLILDFALNYTTDKFSPSWF